jgi:hypothetical protein
MCPWLRRLVASISPRSPGFAPRSIYVGFMVGKVALGQVFFRVLLFFPASSISQSFSTLIYHTGMNDMSLSGSSSETWSHPINIYKLQSGKHKMQCCICLLSTTLWRRIGEQTNSSIHSWTRHWGQRHATSALPQAKEVRFRDQLVGSYVLW